MITATEKRIGTWLFIHETASFYLRNYLLGNLVTIGIEQIGVFLFAKYNFCSAK